MKKILLALYVLSFVSIIIFISCKKEKLCAGCIDNKPPIANAGSDQVITSPTDSILLDGSTSSDPDGTISEWLWKKISGPSSFNITNANSIQTQATNLVEGIYQFELKVTDARGLFSTDTMKVTVNASMATTDCNGNIRLQVNAQLIFLNSLSLARNEMAVASANNKILFAGGWLNGGGYSSRVDIYDVTNNSWTTAELSEPRANMAPVVLGNKIFFAGGDNNKINSYGNPDISDRVDIYDATTNTWTTATLSEKRTFITGAAAGNKVLFAGGAGWWLGGGNESLKVDIYDVSSNTWSVDYLPDRGIYESLGIAATTIGNKIYFAGAAGNWFAWDFGGSYSSRITIYDASSGNWSTSQLSKAKGAMGAIAIGNKIYWAGGMNTNFGQSTMLPIKVVEIMDVNTGSVSFDCLFQPNSGMAAVQKNSSLVFFTAHTTQVGWLPSGIITNKFDIYDLTFDRWSIGVLPVSIYDASVISVNNTIYVAGGIVNGNLSNQVWRLEF